MTNQVKNLPPTSVANLPPPGSKEASDAIVAWKEKWRNSDTKDKDIQPLNPGSPEAKSAINAFFNKYQS